MKKVEVCAYNPIWKDQFEKLNSLIWPVVSDYADRIEHVGSTSVEGLWAKPVIDLDIVVKSEDCFRGVIESLSSLGYRHRGDLGIAGREAFRKDNAEFKHNLYACLETALPFQNHIALRNHLRKYSEDRDEYSDLKRKLAAQFPEDIDSYIDGKTDFILSILRRYGLDRDDLAQIEAVNKL